MMSTSRHQLMIRRGSKTLLSSSSRKRRRGKPPALAPTTKDRIRKRQVPPNTGWMTQQNVELLTERMETRIEWLQKGAKEFFSPASSPSSQSSSASSSAERGVVIDANWWFWNLLLALSPGIMIALACEFYVKPQMHQMHLDNGGEPPPPPLTWKESFDELVDFVQTALWMKSVEDNNNDSDGDSNGSSRQSRSSVGAANSNTLDNNSINNNDPLRLEIQQLKEKLQTLEDRVLEKRQDNPQQQRRSNIWKRHHRQLEPDASKHPAASSNEHENIDHQSSTEESSSSSYMSTITSMVQEQISSFRTGVSDDGDEGDNNDKSNLSSPAKEEEARPSDVTSSLPPPSQQPKPVVQAAKKDASPATPTTEKTVAQPTGPEKQSQQVVVPTPSATKGANGSDSVSNNNKSSQEGPGDVDQPITKNPRPWWKVW